MSLHKKSSLEQSSSLHNLIHDIINRKHLKKEMGKNLKFPQEWLKDETRHIVQLIHLKGWAGHFEHEYIIKLSKDFVPHQLNLMQNSDQRLALFRQK